MKTLLVQTDITWRDPAANRRRIDGLLGEHLDAHDLAVLPETFTTGFPGDPLSGNEGMDGESVEWLLRVARHHKVQIACSAALEDDGFRNRFLWVSPDGGLEVYDKKHLFGVGGEDRNFTAGRKRMIFNHHGWRVCPQICYDIRFPVWCRNLGDYDLLLVVANWPEARVSAWDCLLRARAIENQCYVVAVNRVGEDGNGLRYPGHSQVFDPMGERLVFAGTGEACITVDLSLDHLNAIRQKFPFQADADPFRLTT